MPGDGATLNVGAGRGGARQGRRRSAQRALAGESFEKLAAELSDAPSQANAGLIGPLSLDDLSPELRKLIEAMKVGDDHARCSARRAGYQILKLESIDAAPRRCRSSRRASRSASACSPTSGSAEFEKYLEQLRAQAIIEWKNAELKKAYERGAEAGRSAAAGASRRS